MFLKHTKSLQEGGGNEGHKRGKHFKEEEDFEEYEVSIGESFR